MCDSLDLVKLEIVKGTYFIESDLHFFHSFLNKESALAIGMAGNLAFIINNFPVLIFSSLPDFESLSKSLSVFEV
jgi:hypothetical protein